jgi:uncharacterized protein YdbL (DUF1318 family)
VINFKQGSTQRGIVRLLVVIGAAWSWFKGDTEQAMAAFLVGEAINGWLGINKEG